MAACFGAQGFTFDWDGMDVLVVSVWAVQATPRTRASTHSPEACVGRFEWPLFALTSGVRYCYLSPYISCIDTVYGSVVCCIPVHITLQLKFVVEGYRTMVFEVGKAF